MSHKANYFLGAIFAALAALACFFAGFFLGGGLQIVLTTLGGVGIAGAGALLAVGLAANRDE